MHLKKISLSLLTLLVLGSETLMAQTKTKTREAVTPKPVVTQKTAGNSTTATKSPKPASAARLRSGSTKSTFSIGLQLEPALPVGNASQASSFGIGGSVVIKYPLAEKFGLRASLGYQSFLGKTLDYSYDDGTGNIVTQKIKADALGALPLRVGATYDLTDKFFAQAMLGIAFLNHSAGTAFIYSPGIGYKTGQLEAAIKYEGWAKTGSFSFIGLTLDYFFH